MNRTNRICIAVISVMMLMVCPMLTVASSSADAGTYAGAGYGDGLSVTYLDKAGDERATLKVTFDTVPEDDIYLTMDSFAYSVIPVSYLKGNLLDIYVSKVSQGVHTLHAEYGDFSGNVSFTVGPYVPVSSVTMNKDSAETYVGKTIELRAIVSPDNASFKDAVWTSSDNSIATVDGGCVKGIKEGNAVITATVDGKTADCLVKVSSEVEVIIVDHGDGSKTITETNKVTGNVKVTETKDTLETDGSVKTVSSSTTKDKNGVVLSTVKSTSLSKDGTATTSSETTDASGNVVRETVAKVDTEMTLKDKVPNASASLSSINEAVSQINKVKDTYGSSNIEVNICVETSSKSSVVKMDSGSIAKVASIDGAAITIETSNGSMTFDGDVLSSMSGKPGEINIGIGIADQSSLSDEQKRAVGENAVFELSMSIGSESIHILGGKVTVTVPYTLKNGEDASNVAVWYLNDTGELTKVDGAVYDKETGTVTFIVDHFSKYVVGIDDVSGNNDTGVSAALIAAIAVVVILLIAFGIIIVITKKKKKNGGDGPETK